MEDEEEKPPLPMDIMAKIPTHISDPASLARAAASHKLWRDLIKDPAFLDGLRNRRHGGCHGFTSSLLLGFFYQESSEAPSHTWQHHEDQHRCLAPSFLPTSELLGQLSGSREEGCNAAAARRLPMSLASFFQDVDAHANFYEPVASQAGFLALRRRAEDQDGDAMPDVVRVCNPLTGQLFHVPKRFDRPPPQHYFLLVDDDYVIGADGGRACQSFRLVCVWMKGKKVVYVYYCLKTRRWRTPASTPEVRAGLYLMPSHAAASCHGTGSIHWLCGSWKSMAPTHVATLRLEEEELLYAELPPEARSSSKAPPLLATSADGGILLLLVKGLQMSLWRKHTGSDWVLSERIDMAGSLPMRALTTQAKIRLEIFRGESGVAVAWVEGEGLFLFYLADRSMRKIDNENVAKRYFFCPYEIDWLSCLAVTNLAVDDCLDEARAKIHGRWKTLIANNV